MNAPTGRKARVSVIERAIAASDFPKSLPMAVRVMTTRKKSNASSVQPRKPAATVAFWSLAAGRGVVIVGGERTSRLHHFPHGCDVAHAAVPAHAPLFR